VFAISATQISYASPLTPEIDESTLKHTPKEELKRLNAYIAKNKKSKKDLQPFIYALEGEIAIEKGHMITAGTKLRAALSTIDGVLGRKILKLLVENEAKRYGFTKKKDYKIISHIMKLHKKKKIAIFSEMKNYGSKKVRKLLAWHVPKLVESAKEAQIVSDLLPPTKKDLKADPKFDKIAVDYCTTSHSKNGAKKWNAWIANLEPVEKAYWKARIDECAGRGQKAVNGYLELAKKYKDDDDHWDFALWSAKRAVIWQRRNAQRKQAAINYKLLAELWIENAANPKDFGLSRAELYREKANDLLWAARYRALIGHYEEAEKYCVLALDISEKGIEHITASTKRKVRKDLLEFRIEGFQTPADRVFIEKGDFEEARSLILKAKSEKSPEKVWDDRLVWYDGFYAFLTKDYQATITAMEELHKITKDDSSKSKSLFWKARALAKLGKSQDAKKVIDELTYEYPLSYYSVVAAPLIFDGVKDWKTPFKSVKSLRKNLENPEVFKLNAFKYVEDGITLAKQSHGLIEAKLPRYAKDTSFDLYNRSKKKISLLKRPEIFVYLSRMLYASGNYLWAIVISNQLQENDSEFWNKWPEQILVFFPRPHMNPYETVAESLALPKSLLYSISRQESAFNEKAVSPARAFGLMQLIIPTARNMAKKMGYKTNNLKETLLTPSENIKFGGNYLKVLSQRYENVGPFVYAAYNAGEGAVDTWIERRNIKDRLSWIEAIPYGETRGYVKNVARNMSIYTHLLSKSEANNQYTTSGIKRAVMKGLKRRTFKR
jgi:soluble lytic murein transglycosylase-like protein